MLRITLLCLALTGLQAAPLALRVSHEEGLTGEFRHSEEPSPRVLPDDFRQGTEPSRCFLVDLNTGRVMEHISEMQRSAIPVLTRSEEVKASAEVDRYQSVEVVKASRGIERHHLDEVVKASEGIERHHLDEVETPVQRSGASWVRVEKHFEDTLPDGFRQGTEPMSPIPDGFRQGTEPIMSLPEGFRQGTELSAFRLNKHEPACEGKIIMGRCYRFNAQPLSFQDAQAACKGLAPNSDLASMTDERLHSDLVSLVTEDAAVSPVLTWLGAVVKNQQAEWVYSDLMRGHPNVHSVTPVCLEMFRIDERWWTTVDCELQRASVCSYPVTA